MIDRPALVRMTKDEREMVIVQSIASIADSLVAIKDEVAAIRKSMHAADGAGGSRK